MKMRVGLSLGALILAGCATNRPPEGPAVVVHPFPAQSEQKPKPLDWEEIDKSTQRTKERALEKQQQSRATVTDKVESGFLPMTEEEYATAKTKAADEIRRTNPKLSENDVECAAVARADEEKRHYEQTYRTRSSTSYEWKTTGH